MEVCSIMTISRALKIDLNLTPYYHCMSRCVRRTYLCGQDDETGKDFSHRKEWIVKRIKQLSSIFAIKICAYAVMSNHYHLVLFISQTEAKSWDDKEVVERWKRLFPGEAKKLANKDLTEEEVKAKLSLWREQLLSISWFMRCLNEPIARSSNHEDNCTGRFWEGRFKSQALLDEGAVLSAMAYVDLNPIRAKVANTPEESEFTSIYERINEMAKSFKKKPTQDIDETKQPSKLMSFASGKNQESTGEPKIDFRLSDYLTLIDTTGRILRQDKRGSISENLSPILFRLNLTTRGWMDMVKGLEKGFFHAIGHESKLLAFGERYLNRGPKGMSAAKRCYLNVA